MCQKKLFHVIMFLVFSALTTGCVVGLYFTIDHVQHSYFDCKVKDVLNKNCYNTVYYPSRGAPVWVTVMEQYVELSGNKTGFFLCGDVPNCNVECGKDISINKTYVCSPYNNNLYIVGEPPVFFYFLIAFISFFVLVFAIGASVFVHIMVKETNIDVVSPEVALTSV